jgi:hypothetical protein
LGSKSGAERPSSLADHPGHCAVQKNARQPPAACQARSAVQTRAGREWMFTWRCIQHYFVKRFSHSPISSPVIFVSLRHRARQGGKVRKRPSHRVGATTNPTTAARGGDRARRLWRLTAFGCVGRLLPTRSGHPACRAQRQQCGTFETLALTPAGSSCRPIPSTQASATSGSLGSQSEHRRGADRQPVPLKSGRPRLTGQSIDPK